ALANRVIHQVRPDAITVAEDVSGMPGLCAPVGQGGAGFGYRLAMGVPDCWFRLVREVPDEAWDLGWLWHELNNRRPEERVVSYAESHDQALVGGKSLIFELIDAAMYDHMHRSQANLAVERGVALHKMIRLATLATAGHGYLTFMGNEFGHPEWVDFPREGNAWSYRYARRQWSLADDPDLRYHGLGEFDRAMVVLARDEGFLGRDEPRLLALRAEDQVLAWARGRCYFLFNFHPTRSVADYPVEVPPGAYDLVLDTDEPRFAGPGRVAPGQRFLTHPLPGGHLGIRVYLPSRCALVLRRNP
ncbi:MAG: 1,4-alpha-glucan-branching enzyme, partial [Candidatus Dadabacteria bacterium]